ncbi:AcrR family transcriptional regulator [Crossiella equi]|uniref:AcrR family transcriptional regulator n=1 Tax=Crossiella equi TaxID=130796 RepID=A0ABS5ANH9_9PSEU|nr:TetR/AcrR family transcriptional regulator [Crossiella equi]MBP2478133.1 AcrR family transcriptional regulator [Crossiella equi]
MPKIVGGSLSAHREQTRTRIFAALSRLAAERGYDAITLAEVAAAAEVGRTAMYNHFPDKESLLLAYAEHETGGYLRELTAELAALDNPVDKLAAYVRLHIRVFATRHMPPSSALRPLLSEQGRVRVLDHVAELEATLRRVLGSGIEAGYLPATSDLDALVPLVTACVSGRSLSGMAEPALTEATEQTVAFVLRGVGARQGPDGRPRRLPKR